jgi:hypothetical protein
VIGVWWQYVVAVAVLIALVYMLSVIAGFQTRMLTRRSHNSVEGMYDRYGTPGRKRRGDHDGEA